MHIIHRCVSRCAPSVLCSLFTVSFMSSSVKLYVKAGKDTQTLGDCPFSQKALLALNANNIPYEVTFIDTANKPEFYTRDINPKGTVPAAVLSSGEVITDSDDIIKKCCDGFFVEDPELHDKCNIMGAIVGYAKNKDPDTESEVRDTLVKKLEVLNEHVTATNCTYFMDDTLGYFDCKLVPFLNHIRVALHHYKGFAFLTEERFSALVNYYHRVAATETYRRSAYDDSESIRGFSKFFD